MKFKKGILSKSLSLILILSIIFTPIISLTTYASENQKYIVGPTVTVDLGILGSSELKQDKNGNYSGELTPLSSTGLTSVTCVLSGGTGGISNLYQIYIKWKGSNQVANIRAQSLKISSTSVLNPKTYWQNSFFIDAGSKTLGFKSIGTCTIPTSVKKVRIKTEGLQCFFNDRDWWISTGELNGTVNVN